MMIVRLPAQWAFFFHGLAAGDPRAGAPWLKSFRGVYHFRTRSNQECGAKVSFNPRSTGCQGKGFIASIK